MSSAGRLSRRIFIFGFIGLIAFLIDSWARANTQSFIALMELGVLVVWIGVDFSAAFRGHLKAGPEKADALRAIEMPSYQIFIAIYLTVIAFIMIFISDSASVSNYFDSPFLVWLLAAPAIVIAFVLEFRGESQRNKN